MIIGPRLPKITEDGGRETDDAQRCSAFPGLGHCPLMVFRRDRHSLPRKLPRTVEILPWDITKGSNGYNLPSRFWDTALSGSN